MGHSLVVTYRLEAFEVDSAVEVNINRWGFLCTLMSDMLEIYTLDEISRVYTGGTSYGTLHVL